MSNPSDEAIVDLCGQAIAAELRDDGEALGRALDAIAKGGGRDVYAALCGWCGVIWTDSDGQLPPSIRDHAGADGFYRLEVEHAPTGVTGAEHAPPHVRWVGQFLTAFANGDRDTTTALFKAAVADEDLLAQVSLALLQLAASRVRRAAGESR